MSTSFLSLSLSDPSRLPHRKVFMQAAEPVSHSRTVVSMDAVTHMSPRKLNCADDSSASCPASACRQRPVATS
jgi:hypothetical protein